MVCKHRFMICDCVYVICVCVCILCVHLRVGLPTYLWGFLYFGVWLKMPIYKSANPFSPLFQEAFSLKQVATFLAPLHTLALWG